MGKSEGKRTLGRRSRGWKDDDYDDDDNNNNNNSNNVSRNGMGTWTGLTWLRIGTGIGLL
jgi:hypothetical protein